MNLPSEENQTIAFYDDHARDYCKQTVGIDMSTLYEPFLACIPAGGRILDAGCGSGRDARYFREKGYDVVAFDASKEMAQLASHYIGQEVHHLRFQDITFDAVFDGIWASASLLHVRPVDTADVLRRLTNALKPCGVMYASVKIGDGEEFRDGRLFVDYDETSLVALISHVPELALIKQWQSADLREGRDEKWLNVLALRDK